MKNILALMATSCGVKPNSQVRYTKDGEKRTQVKVVPVVIDKQPNLPWNVSEELTSKVYYFLSKSRNLYFDKEDVLLEDLA
ncbi:MAG: DUF7499 family protein [Chlamydiota bacterium]